MKRNIFYIFIILGISYFFYACASTNTQQVKNEIKETENIIKEASDIQEGAVVENEEGKNQLNQKKQQKKDTVKKQQSDIKQKSNDILRSTEEVKQLISESEKKGEQSYNSPLSFFSAGETDPTEGDDYKESDGYESDAEENEDLKTSDSMIHDDAKKIVATNRNSNIQPVGEPVVSQITTYKDDGAEKAFSTESIITNLILQWAESWSKMDYFSYIKFYKDDYKPTPWISHEKWLEQRKKRMERKYINVELSNINVDIIDNSTVQVSFNQYYESNTYSDNTRKMLIFNKINNYWFIVKEDTLQ